MCQRVTCESCGKPTYAGCGRHVEAVLGDVPSEARCRCREAKAKPRASVMAVVESAGGVASRVSFGAHELVFDQPRSVPGGEDRGPSPLDVMAVTVGACAHYFAAAFLQARKLPVEGLKVEVAAEKVREPQPRFGKLSIRVKVPAGVPDQYLSQIERVVRNCPAYGTLVHPPELELTFCRENPHAPAA